MSETITLTGEAEAFVKHEAKRRRVSVVRFVSEALGTYRELVESDRAGWPIVIERRDGDVRLVMPQEPAA